MGMIDKIHLDNYGDFYLIEGRDVLLEQVMSVQGHLSGLKETLSLKKENSEKLDVETIKLENGNEIFSSESRKVIYERVKIYQSALKKLWEYENKNVTITLKEEACLAIEKLRECAGNMDAEQMIDECIKAINKII